MNTTTEPRYGVKILAVTDRAIEGMEIDGEFHAGEVWLARYDADGNDGAGDFGFTLDPSEAMSFAKAADATLLWRQVSVVRPLRDDGKPNRPLSMFTIEITKVPVE